MGVDGTHELALEFQRDFPQEAQQQRAHVVVLQQQVPQGADKCFTEFVLLEFPGDGIDALGNEGLLKKLWIMNSRTRIFLLKIFYG